MWCVHSNRELDCKGVLERSTSTGSLPADVPWGSFVTHSFLPRVGEKRMRDERPPKDACGEAGQREVGPFPFVYALTLTNLYC